MIASYVVFNSEKTIEESLRSILPYVKKVIMLDGAFRRFPHDKPYSTDKTESISREICGSKLQWVSCTSAWDSQVAKRNASLDLIPNGKWFIIMSSDNILEGQISKVFKFAESSTFDNIAIKCKNYYPIWDGYEVRYIEYHAYPFLTKPIPRNKWNKLQWGINYGKVQRIILKRKGLRYQGHHSRLLYNNQVLKPQYYIDEICIVNMAYKISWERWHQKLKYKRERYEAGDFEG